MSEVRASSCRAPQWGHRHPTVIVAGSGPQLRRVTSKQRAPMHGRSCVMKVRFCGRQHSAAGIGGPDSDLHQSLVRASPYRPPSDLSTPGGGTLHQRVDRLRSACSPSSSRYTRILRRQRSIFQRRVPGNARHQSCGGRSQGRLQELALGTQEPSASAHVQWCSLGRLPPSGRHGQPLQA